MSQARSQISKSPLSLRRSQNPKKSKSVFVACLEEAGLKISQNEEPHVLTQEQSLFVRDLEKILECSEKNHQEFLKGMKQLCDDENRFKKALMLTNLRKEDGNQTIEKIEQECLFRLFLRVQIIQTEAMEFLLEEITTTASEVEEDTSWLHMLLNPLRYLPYIKEPNMLTKKLLDILEIATQPAQLEILDSIPEIVPDEEYTEMARELSKLLDSNDEISGGIVDCLNALNLDPAIRSEVQERILEKISGGTSLNTFPVFLSFLMTDCKSENLVNVLLKIRNALDVMLVSDNMKEKESFKVLIFNKLQSYTISSKLISDAWLNMISMMKVHSDHRSVDYLILFMLHSCVQFKKRLVEAIFKKRVRDGVFKISQLERVFEKSLLQQFLKDYFKSIIEIGCSLIRSPNDQTVADYSTILFQLIFSHKYTEVIYQREILDNLLILAGASDKRTVGTVLKIISSLNKNILKKHTALLMRLLEKLDTLELKDAKEVFEILCSLTFAEDADESVSGFGNEIHMIVRKQLYSTKRPIKHRGIISAVVMAKYLAITSVHQEGELPENLTSVSRLPPGPAREAASILELTATCTKSCSELTGLYYDQFASILVFNSQFEKHFLEWAYQTIGTEFRKTFVVSHIPNVPPSVNDMDMTMQYSLRSPSSPEKGLGINIAGHVVTNSSKIMILSSHFRLLRLLHYRLHDGILSGIDALLGTPVILPNIQLDDLEPDQARIVADCLFHCANWFREIISGFVTQTNKKLRARVVRRLEDLLEVEKKLTQCLTSIPEHKLPVSYFDSVVEIGRQNNQQVKSDGKPKGNPRKRLKTTDPNETANTPAAPSQTKKRTATKHSVSSEHAVHFREIDTDIILLIKYPLVFDEDSPVATQTASLSIDQLKFILKDFVGKLSTLIRNKDQGVSQLDMVAPIEIMSDGVFILPHIDSHLKVMVKKINELVRQADGVLDSPELFTEEATDYKICFGLILEAFYLIFSWSGFQQSRNLEVLKKLLKSMRKDPSQPNSAHLLIVDFINTVAEYSEQCLELSHGVYLIQLMEALHGATTPNPEIKKKIVSVANKLLSRRWYNSKGQLDNGRNCKLNIDILLKAYLSSANIKTIGGLVATLQKQAPEIQIKEDSLPMLRSIDKANFHVLYNAFCSALHNRVKSEVQSLTNSQHLVLWDTTALTMQNLMSIAKVQETKTNLVCFLKKSIGILKIFMTHGIPILEIMLRSRSEEVVAVFKAMQISTRFLHHLCCYSKLTRDASLMAFVPKFRLTLETLVYRVKAALAANKCLDAFWLGNLRNRNLQGEDILSQTSDTTAQTDETNENDELPDDDSDNISEILNEDGSDVFD